MSKSLVLTLGHNSSAILVENGQILAGYEEERFSKIKSDSQFPIQSINKIESIFGAGEYDSVCVGHWFTAGILANQKYVDMGELVKRSGVINSICTNVSHHDSHHLSAAVFAKSYDFPSEYTSIVADGFGTFGECISVYAVDRTGHRLLRRVFDYKNSLGMLYQYATAYMGMKMHNHEYKMLGYEAHITDVLTPSEIEQLDELILKESAKRLKAILQGEFGHDTDPVVNKTALAATQHEIGVLLDLVLLDMGRNISDRHNQREIISYFVQGVVEKVICSIVELHNPKNLLVSGGLFYNVKLNHRLADTVDKFCVMPLAGDQGAGLGVYQAYHGDLVWPKHLFWGHRALHSVNGAGIVNVQDEYDAIDVMRHRLMTDGAVNIVRGAMEFGPRSLCNTATIALPNMDIVHRINEMNDRTTVMPMAPAMTRDYAYNNLVDADKIVGSLEYMVATREINSHLAPGASHYYPLTGKSTCRPQIVSESDVLMNSLLDEFGPLINTSFNYHGVPIAFEADSIEYSHDKQNGAGNITTVVINN
jgi:carbamoyltransferase